MYCIMCSPLEVKFPSTTIYSPLCPLLPPPPPLPLVITTLLSMWDIYIYTFFLLNSFAYFTQLPTPPFHWQMSVFYIYESVSILLVCLFCSLDSIYEWNHMVLVFLWLAYFTEHSTLHRCIYAVTKGKISFLFYGQIVYSTI